MCIDRHVLGPSVHHSFLQVTPDRQCCRGHRLRTCVPVHRPSMHKLQFHHLKKRLYAAGGSRQTGPGGATAPVLQQAHKSELSFCFLPYQNATQQRRRTRRQRTERREPWQGTLQDLFCNARQTEGGSATTCSVAAHKQHKILFFPDPHAREPRQGQSFPYRFQGSCHHLAPTTLHRPSTTSGRTAAIWQRRQQRMK